MNKKDRRTNPSDRNQARANTGQRKKRRRHGRYIIHYTLLILLVLGVGLALSMTVFFQIKSIQVEGDSPYTQEELVAASGIQLQDNLWRVQQDEVEQNIKSQFPYISQVELRRVLPDKLVLQVTAETPALALQGESSYTLLNADGKILEKNTYQVPDGAWRVVGLNDEGKQPGETLDGEDQAEKLNMLHLLQEAVAQTGFTGIELVDLSDRLNLCFYYGDRFLVQLGSESNLVNKLRLLQEVLENNVQEGEVGILDASINKRVSIIPYAQEQMAELMPYLNGPTAPEESQPQGEENPEEETSPSQEEPGGEESSSESESTSTPDNETSEGASDSSSQQSTESGEGAASQAA